MRSAAFVAACAAALLAAACGGSGKPESRQAESAKPASRPADSAAKQGCAPTPGSKQRVAPAAEGTPSRVRLGPGGDVRRSPRTVAAGRRGPRLLVTGVVHGPDCAPLAGATVRAWQTNGDGDYGPTRRGNMRCCYLQGTALTDRRGRYLFRSVVPGAYGDGIPHIHVEVGHPDAGGILTELLFGAAASRLPRVPDATAVSLERGREGGRKAFRTLFDVVLPGNR